MQARTSGDVEKGVVICLGIEDGTLHAVEGDAHERLLESGYLAGAGAGWVAGAVVREGCHCSSAGCKRKRTENCQSAFHGSLS